MPVLTQNEINQTFPDRGYVLKFTLNPEKWTDFNIPQLPEPSIVKFSENIKNDIPHDVRTQKGLYMFIIDPCFPFKPDIKYLVYVGRVRSGTTNFNFHKRFDDYKRLIGNANGSLNKVLLTNLWPEHTYVYFYNMSNEPDERISETEDQLIKKIIPPLNARIGGETEQTRDLY